jgi:hypothetical protein
MRVVSLAVPDGAVRNVVDPAGSRAAEGVGCAIGAGLTAAAG